MQRVKLRGSMVESNPYRDDLFRKVIEQRKLNKSDKALYLLAENPGEFDLWIFCFCFYGEGEATIRCLEPERASRKSLLEEVAETSIQLASCRVLLSRNGILLKSLICGA